MIIGIDNSTVSILSGVQSYFGLEERLGDPVALSIPSSGQGQHVNLNLGNPPRVGYDYK